MDFSLRCPTCKALGLPGAEFCVVCGARLEKTVAPSPSPQSQASVRQGDATPAGPRWFGWMGWGIAMVLAVVVGYQVLQTVRVRGISNGPAKGEHRDSAARFPEREPRSTGNSNEPLRKKALHSEDAKTPTNTLSGKKPLSPEDRANIDMMAKQAFDRDDGPNPVTPSEPKKVDGFRSAAPEQAYTYSEFEAWSRFPPGASSTMEIETGGKKLLWTSTLKSKTKEVLRIETTSKFADFTIPNEVREVRRRGGEQSCIKCAKPIVCGMTGKDKVRIGNREVEVTVVTFSHDNCEGLL